MYIFDTGALILLFKHYYRNRFPSLWEKFDDYIANKEIISVKEVYNEIQNCADRDSLLKWAELHKNDVFLPASEDEMKFVSEMFKIPHYRQLISQRAIISGSYQADPFVIASGYVNSACVVTTDGFDANTGKIKEHAPKVAYICQKFNVECCNLEQFMEKENWIF